MKEAVGESSMTVLTIIIVSFALGGLLTIIMTLVGHQGKRSACENAGGTYENSNCIYDGSPCQYIEDENEYICG